MTCPLYLTFNYDVDDVDHHYHHHHHHHHPIFKIFLIAVGVILLLCGLVTTIIILVIRRRRKKQRYLIIIIIIIIITRPKPTYGRQGQAGSWGQDTDEVNTFLVFLTSHFAPAALSSDLTNLGPLTMESDQKP